MWNEGTNCGLELPLRPKTNPETHEEFRGLLEVFRGNSFVNSLEQARATVSRSGFQADVDVGVDVRIASEVPYERRTFDSPHIPDLIVLQVAVRVVRHV